MLNYKRSLAKCMVGIALSSFAFSALAVTFPEPEEVIQVNDVLLAWDHPGFRDDETVLDVDEIAGYRVGYGLVSDEGPATIINAGKVTEFKISNMPSGIYSFTVMSIDVDGLESLWAREVTHEILSKSRPGAPDSLGLSVSSEVASTTNAVGYCMTSNRCVAVINLQWSKNTEEGS